jgi:hypothetical protein
LREIRAVCVRAQELRLDFESGPGSHPEMTIGVHRGALGSALAVTFLRLMTPHR